MRGGAILNRRLSICVVDVNVDVVTQHDLGVSQSLRSVSDRPDPTGKSISEARKMKNIQNSSLDTVEPAAAPLDRK